ncbi:gustatory receptor 5a for trehalose-like isoform X2 [Ceratina calcarata]|uniref:Gustatory receptor n=1 Tax=Ceratina calcarata TaxID=156304 RepID=A0AAJ7IYX5_9HYME|nr:gustatory receptor 5a for trehalose-like isoform X2 [Ceratina calcarata]
MITCIDVRTENQFMMLKSTITFSRPKPIKKRRSSRKLWVSFTYHKNDNTEETDVNQANDSFAERAQNTMENFHCAIGPILCIAQVFGLFPVSGIRCPSLSKLQFKRFSFLTVYSACLALMVCFMTVISVIHMLKTFNTDAIQARGGIGAATVGAVFYGNSLLASVSFFWLSSRWVPLQYEWRAMEQYVDRNSSETTRLRWKFYLISFVILVCSFTEHVLSIFNNVEGYDWHGSNSTFRNFMKIYTLRSHSFLFDTLNYNFAFGIYIFVISKIATFTWNFTDLFIMLVATGLAEKYKSLNKRLAVIVTRHQSLLLDQWAELREKYATLSCFVKNVDDHISHIVLLSFANNLYFICVQLLNGLSSWENSLSAVYFFGSFGFLIGRTCAVTLLTARIYDQSKEALPHLYRCSPSNYCIEVQRLQHQLATDEVTLTGLRFFSITRNFMLAVVGAIITYEVLLLQFNDNK